MPQDPKTPRKIRTVPPRPPVIAPDIHKVQAGKNTKPISSEGKPQPSPPPPPSPPKKSK